MPVPQLKTLAKKSGIAVKKIEKDYYPKAKKIAKDMGMEDNFAYIYGILENMLGIEESVVHKEIANGFLKSDKTLKEYLDSLYEGGVEEEITSSSIGPTPEGPKRKKDCDEEIEDEEDDEVEETCSKDHKKK